MNLSQAYTLARSLMNQHGLHDKVLGEMIKFLSAIRMTGARPESVLEAVSARVAIAAANKEQEITITPLTMEIITGNFKA